MFLLSVRAKKRRLIPFVLSVALIAAMLIASLIFPASRTMITVGAVTVQGDEDVATWLRTCGYAVTIPAAEVREVQLPDTFDGALADYERLQVQAGFSLEDYAGQRATCRTYALRDHESGEGAAVHLYLLQDRVIGGDITASDGTLFPLIAVTPIPERT